MLQPVCLLIICAALGGAEQKVADRFAQAKTFEERSHLAVLLGESPAPADLAAAKTLLLDRGESAELVALRRLVTGGLAKNPNGFELVVLATGDPDPGVRLQAIEAMEPRFHPRLIELFQRDDWPEVRLRALSAIAVSGKKDDVVVEACFDRAQPYQLRSHAARLLASAKGSAVTNALNQGLLRVEEEALVTEVAHPLFRQLVATMGQRQDPGALPELLRVGQHSPIPVIQAEAVLALSRFCTAEARRVIELAAHSSEREVELAGHRGQSVCRGN